MAGSNPLSFADKPVFVVGAPRSGTTLTARILDLHPEIYSPGESHFFEDVWSRRDEIGSLQLPAARSAAVERMTSLFGRFNFPETQNLVDQLLEQGQLQQELAQCDDYRSLYTVMLGRLTQLQGKLRFCDDTPKHLYHLTDILHLFPQAKIIVSIRDPRDFLCSYKNYWRRSRDSARVKALYHPIITSLLWRSSVALALKSLKQYSSEQIYLLTYEQLVENPEQQIQQLCSFLEIVYSPKLLQVAAQNSSFGEDGVQSPGIFRTSIGRWRACLDPVEIWWAQTLTGALMKELRYESEDVPLQPLQIIAVLLAMPLALLNALQANAHKRGPLLQYLSKRFLSLLGRT